MLSLTTAAVVLISIAVPAAPQRPAHYDALIHLAQESLEGCYEDDAQTIKIEFSDEGFAGLVQGSRDAGRSTKCLRYCIMRKNKLFNEENQLNSDEMLQFFAKLYGTIVEEDTLKDVVVYCKVMAANEKDSCERAHTAAMCILGSLKERGYDQL